MFIRKKIKTAKGKTYLQHQLLRSERTPSGPRQEVILNLGQLTLPKEQWKALADAIEDRLNNVQEETLSFSFFEKNEEIERLADHYAQMVINKNLNAEKKEPQAQTNETPKQAFEKVDIHSLKTTESKSIGAEYLIVDQMKLYQLDSILKGLGWTDKQLNYAKMLIIGRAVHPSSERELTRWVNESSAVQELIGSEEKIYDNAFHRVATMLSAQRPALEKELSQKARDLFSLEEKIILFDLTNTYFEGQKKDCPIAQFGHSKEKRSDCKLTTLALVVDSEGFPKESKILAGNIAEAGTLKDFLQEIKKMGDHSAQKTIVLDAGIATEENIALMKQEKMNYVAISRKKSFRPSFWDQSTEKKILLKDGETELRLKWVEVKEQNEGFLLCHSKRKEVKEREIHERKMKKFEEALKKLHEGLKKKKAQNRYDKIMERIGRLKEKYGVGTYFNIKVIHENERVQEIFFEENPKGKARSEKFGEYVIRTNRLDLSETEISAIHRTLVTIEESFRSMKSELGMRPNYHKREDTTIAHIFISVMAYHMVFAIIKRLRNAGIFYSWDSIRKILANHNRVVTAFNTEDDQCIHVRNTTLANATQKTIYDALNLKQDPLRNVMMKKSRSEPKKCSAEING